MKIASFKQYFYRIGNYDGVKSLLLPVFGSRKRTSNTKNISTRKLAIKIARDVKTYTHKS